MKILNVSSILQRLKMKIKFILMLSVPLLALTYFSISEITRRLAVSKEMDAIVQLSDFASRASNTIHELQKERGRTAGFVGSNGEKFSVELTAQRADTDSKLAIFREHLLDFDAENFGPQFESLLQLALGKLENLNSTRQNISSLAMSSALALGYYTETISALLDTYGFMSGLTASAEVSNKILTIFNLMEAKERTGIERAVLSNTFGANAFGPGMYVKFISLIAAQEAFLSAFERTASRDDSQLLSSSLNVPAVAEVNRLRQIAKDKFIEGNFGISSADWFEEITSKINILKNVEDELAADLTASAVQSASAAQRAIVALSILVVVSFAFSIVIALLVVSYILSYLMRLSFVTNEVSQGNLTESMNMESEDELGDVGKAVDAMINDLIELIKDLKNSSVQVGNASSNISSSSEQLAAGSEEQQAQLSEVATTMEEMSAMILEASKNADETRENARRTGQTAQEGRELVSKTVSGFETVANTVKEAAGQIQELNRRSEEIGNVIQVIEDIADQTNLLALNANIEAARAGDAGRGFAVVADEVRKLAERTVSATAEISTMIGTIQEDIKKAVISMDVIQTQSTDGLDLVAKSDESLEEISGSITTVVSAVEQIATSSSEQSSGAEEISKNIEGVSTVAKESANSAQLLAASAEQLDQEVKGLDALISRFRIEV